MTARDDLYDALVEGDGRVEIQLRADQLLDAYRDELLRGQFLYLKNDELRERAEQAEADFVIAEQHIERGNVEIDRAWGWVRSLLNVLRPALEHLPAECRYHGDQLDPPPGTHGRAACCDAGVAALRRRNAQRVVDHIEAKHTSKGREQR